MVQYNKQNLLLNQRKTKLNTKEIGDLYEIKIMEKFHPDRLCIFWWSNGHKVSQEEVNCFSFLFFLIFLLRTFTNIFFLENSSLDLSRRNGYKVSWEEGICLFFFVF